MSPITNTVFLFYFDFFFFAPIMHQEKRQYVRKQGPVVIKTW